MSENKTKTEILAIPENQVAGSCCGLNNLEKSEKLTVIDSFCGAGGMSLGLSEAGYDVRFSFDINKKAVRTYTANISSHCHVIDATEINGARLLELAGLERGELDILAGGPPCQGFSLQRHGAHLFEDDRNSLVLQFARLVGETEARAFIFENVGMFGKKRGRSFIESMQEHLDQYDLFTYFVCASDYGLAQRRERFLMLGVLKSLVAEQPVLKPACELRTIRDVIAHLPSPPENYMEHPDYPGHVRCRISQLNKKRFAHVPPGGGWRDIPLELRLPCHQGVDPEKKSNWPDVYGRLRWDGQCPTLTSGFDSFTRGCYGHPDENRALTLHEGALLQGFPEDFRFYGNRHDIRLQIGNAIPPPVAQAAGEALSEVL